MSEIEARLHALLLIELLTAVADEDDVVSADHTPVLATAAAA